MTEANDGTKKKAGGPLLLAALVALECLLLLAAAEFFIAWKGFDTRLLGSLLHFQGADAQVHRPSESVSLHYELIPGTSAVLGDGRVVKVDSLGYRGEERPAGKKAGLRRILCVGSSNTYGALVTQGQTWPEQLERELNARGRGRYEARNAGVCAYVIPQNLEIARKALAEQSPDLLLFQFNNSWRRAFLLGRPFQRYFDEDPALYAENLRFVWPERFGFLGRWRLFRTAVLYLNLSSLRRDREGYDWQKGGALKGRDIESFRRFYEENKGRVKMAVVEVPVPGNPLAGAFDGLGIPVIKLGEKLPPGGDPEFRKIHPAGYVYRWYAKELAGSLEKLGLLDGR